MYLDSGGNPTNESREGWKAAGVPGTVAGLELAHKKLGKKKWSELVSPAEKLASEGFELTYEQARSLQNSDRKLPEILNPSEFS